MSSTTPIPVIEPAAPEVPPPMTPRVEIPEEEQARRSQMVTLFREVREEIETLRQAIRINQEMGARGNAAQMMDMFRNVQVICNKCNAIFDLDVDNVFLIEDDVIDIDELFEELSIQVDALNDFIDSIVRSVHVVVTYRNRIYMNIVSVGPDDPPEQPNHLLMLFNKTAGAYFKEIALVQDLEVADNAPLCECPMCFDELDAKSAIVTNCNHSFCVTCVKGYSTAIKNKKSKRPNCPMCRTNITKFKMGKVDIYEDLRSHIVSL
jgi:zinc-RING finger domain